MPDDIEQRLDKILEATAKMSADIAAKEISTEAKRTVQDTARLVAEATTQELLTRIDERVNHILRVDLSEIKKHLEILNGHVADNVSRSKSNKSQIRNLWIMIIAHLALLGAILGLLVYFRG